MYLIFNVFQISMNVGVITPVTRFVRIHLVLTDVCVSQDTSLDLVVFQKNVLVSISFSTVFCLRCSHVSTLYVDVGLTVRTKIYCVECRECLSKFCCRCE